MTTSIILQTNNENDNTFGDSHFSIILPYTKDHLWAMQLNSFNFRPMFNIFEKNTQYLKVKLSLRYFEPHQSPPDDKWEKKDWVNILSKHVYTFHYEALPFLSSSDFASVGTKIMDENKWGIKWEKENNIPEDTFTEDLTWYCYDEDKKHLFMREFSTWTEIVDNQTVIIKSGTKISDGDFEFIDDVEKFMFYQTYHYAKDDPYEEFEDFENNNMFWHVPTQKYYTIFNHVETGKPYIRAWIGKNLKLFYIEDLLTYNLNYNIYPGKIDDDDDNNNGDDDNGDDDDDGKPEFDYTHDWGEDSLDTPYSHYLIGFKAFYYYDPDGIISGSYNVYKKVKHVDYIDVIYDYIEVFDDDPTGSAIHLYINDIMEGENNNPHMKWSHFSHDECFYWKDTKKHYDTDDKRTFVEEDERYNIYGIFIDEEEERKLIEEEEEDKDDGAKDEEEDDNTDEYAGMRDYGEDIEGEYSHYSVDFKRFYYYGKLKWCEVRREDDGFDYAIYNEYGEKKRMIIDIWLLDLTMAPINPHLKQSFVTNDDHFYWVDTERFYDIVTLDDMPNLHFIKKDNTYYNIEQIIENERETDPPPNEEEEEAFEDLDNLTKLVSVGEFLINPLSQYNSIKNRLEIAFEVSMDVLEIENDEIKFKYYSRGYVYKIEILDITDKLSEITGFVKGQVKEETLVDAKHEIDKKEQKADYLIIRANNMFKPYDFDYLTISCDKVYNTGYIVNQNKYISNPSESTSFYQNQIIGYLMNTVCSNQYMTTGYGFPNKYYIKTSDFLNIRFTLRYDNGEKVDLQSPLTLVLTLSPE